MNFNINTLFSEDIPEEAFHTEDTPSETEDTPSQTEDTPETADTVILDDSSSGFVTDEFLSQLSDSSDDGDALLALIDDAEDPLSDDLDEEIFGTISDVL